MHGSIVQAALAEPEIFYRMGQGQITEVIFQTRSGQDSRSRVKKEWGVVAEKFKEEAVIIQQEELVKNVYSMWLHADKISAAAKPGQFLGLYSSDGSRLLPRPISICETDMADRAVRIVYRIAGKGTAEFSHMRTGMPLNIIGPLGNGFPLKSQKALVVGGGIGIPPLLQLTKELECEKQVILGYRDREMFLLRQFEELAPVLTATEDGSAGTKGNVLDVLRNTQPEGDVIYACGPLPMLRALKAYAKERDMECYLSLEEHMACGVGACLGCVCKTVHRDAHTHVHNTRICTEGPVFLAEEVDI